MQERQGDLSWGGVIDCLLSKWKDAQNKGIPWGFVLSQLCSMPYYSDLEGRI